MTTILEQTQLDKRHRRELAVLFGLLREVDLVNANATWERHAPAAYRGLLRASLATLATAPAGKFWFNPEVARFGYGTRGYVPDSAIRKAVNSFNASHGNALSNLALATVPNSESLAAVSTVQWEASMQRAITDAQIANALAGKGGINAMGGEIVQIEPTIIYQNEKLDRFTTQIEAGKVEREAAARRAAAYALSALPTYDANRRDAYKTAEFTLERNILGPAEHCFARPGDKRPDCPSMSKLGWVPIGGLTPVGLRMCLWYCKCHTIYRKSGEL